MIRFIKLFILIVCICGISFTQTSLNSSNLYSDSSAAESNNKTTSAVLKSAGAIAITALLINYDQQIYDNLNRFSEKNGAVRDIGKVVKYFGEAPLNLGIFGGFVGYGLIFKDKKAIEVGKICFESYLLTNSITLILKQLTGRERPKVATRPRGFWHGPLAYFYQPTGVNKSIDYFTSFPSGHTTTAFATATVISDFYTDNWVSYTCYSMATLVGISRVTENFHWLSDCFVGALVGHFGARLIEIINYGGEDISVIPWVNQEQCGLILCFRIH